MTVWFSRTAIVVGPTPPGTGVMRLALLAAGIILIVTGYNASQSLSSDISRFFTGSATNKAMWMLIGGIVAAVVGLFGVMRSAKT